ncbi:hypothetical protein [Caudoviricetes sp.]|nr:hypothetical protein [Caudoviricetes sp.]
MRRFHIPTMRGASFSQLHRHRLTTAIRTRLHRVLRVTHMLFRIRHFISPCCVAVTKSVKPRVF